MAPMEKGFSWSNIAVGKSLSRPHPVWTYILHCMMVMMSHATEGEHMSREVMLNCRCHDEHV